MKNKLTCKTGLKKNVIKKEVFERELLFVRCYQRKIKENAAGGNAKIAALFLFYGNYTKANC